MSYYDLEMNYGITSVNSLGLALLVLSCLALLGLKRRYALWPIFFMTSYVATGQRIVLFTLDFNFMRVIVLVALLRLLIRNELFSIKKHRIDTLVILFTLTISIAHLARDSSALVFELGQWVDIVGTYYIFRGLIQNWEDLFSAIKGVILIIMPLAVFFVLESMTGRNLFAIFGGVPDITQSRQGRMRSQGAFAHPIIAGVFMAVLMPLIGARWWAGQKKWAIIGLGVTGVIVTTSASSTPIFAVGAGLIGGFMFYFRHHMRMIRWGVFLALIGLHLVMQGPVWSLIARVSAVGGSTSYYRYILIDATIHRFNEWWLIGTESTLQWFYDAGDLTNQFAKVCVDGGFVAFVLFILIISFSFRGVGRIWKRERQDKSKMAMAWAMGVALFMFCMSFIGVSVWGQLVVVWWMLIAMIASIELESEGDVAKSEMPEKGEGRIGFRRV